MLRQKNTSPSEEDRFTEIVDHLNMGIAHLETEEEQLEVARLNLLAGRQAKITGDYPTARQYLTTGSSVLAEECWETQYRITLEFAKEQAEVEYLSGNFARSEKVLRSLLDHARTINDHISGSTLLILHYTLQGRYTEAIQVGENALKLLGMEWNPENVELTAKQELAEVYTMFKLKDPALLLQTPLLTDSSAQMTMQILHSLIFPALYSNFPMYAAIIARIMKISLTSGHAPESISGYARYGVLLGTLYGEYRAGYELGQFAVKLSEKFADPAQKSQTLFTLASELTCWVKHLKFTHAFEQEAYHTALDAGEGYIAGLAIMHRLITLFYEGANLEQIQQSLPQFLEFVQTTHNQVALDVMIGGQLILENLFGNTSDKLSFDTESLSEARFLAQCQDHQNRIASSVYQIMKTQLLYLYGHPQEALLQAHIPEEQLEVVQSLIVRAAHSFLCVLVYDGNLSNGFSGTTAKILGTSHAKSPGDALLGGELSGKFSSL